MSSTVTTTISDVLVASVKQSQDLAARGIDAWTELAAKVPSQPSFGSLPFTDLLPSPTQFVDSGFAIVDEVVAAQKELSSKLLRVVDTKAG
jgi:hypothetical protein